MHDEGGEEEEEGAAEREEGTPTDLREDGPAVDVEAREDRGAMLMLEGERRVVGMD